MLSDKWASKRKRLMHSKKSYSLLTILHFSFVVVDNVHVLLDYLEDVYFCSYK